MIVLAQADSSSATSTSWEFDWPYTAGEWSLVAALAIVALMGIWLYRKDTVSLPRPWTYVLTALRLVVLAGLALILLNPHTRTQTTGFRPSQVAVLIDTSTSMQQPATDVAAGTPAQTRAEAVREVLAGSPLIEELRRTHVVDVYTFDSDLSPQAGRLPRLSDSEGESSPMVDWSALVEPRGSMTRLADSVDKLLVESRSRTLSGVVVFSDGASNAGRDVRTANDRARAEGVRLFAVGVGGVELPVNVAVERVISPSDVQKGDSFEITALVSGTNSGGRTATVELLEQGPNDAEAAVVETADVPLGDDGLPAEARFERQPTAGGAYEYTVRARVPGLLETRDDDNEQSRSVNVFDRPLKVLLISSGPMREYIYSRNVLHRNRGIEIDLWLQTGEPGISQDASQLLFKFPESREELFRYDVLLAFDTDWTKVTDEQQRWIEEWVSTEGGGVLFVAGDVHTPLFAAATETAGPIRTLYPVVLDEVGHWIAGRDKATTAHPLQFTEEGRAAEFLQIGEPGSPPGEAWQDFPGVFRCYPTRARKGGATVYAEFGDPLSRGRDGLPVLLAGQRYGQGAALYLGSPELWRLRGESESYYERLWTKLTRKVAEGRSKRGVQRGLVILEGREFELGQTVPIRVRAVNAQFEKLSADSVRIEVFDPRGRPLIPSPVLQRDRNRETEYSGQFRVGLPGRYRIEFEVPDSNEKAATEIVVTVPQREFASLQQDVASLQTLVDGTGGRYLPLARSGELAALLPDSGQEFLIDQRIKELWDRDWMLWMLVGLLSLEWLLRKLLKLA
ncbi:MAG: VWA domain-containing protein [Planctomyces sp.]|nr:VWA domain-containing protein [Planctomyces sp.]